MPEFMQVMESMGDWNGYRKVRNGSDAAQARLLDLIHNREGLPAHRREYLLKEVITTTDFPDLFGFITEREMLARYRAYTPPWEAYCATGIMPNFNPGEAHKVQGNDALMPRVPQKGEYYVQPVDDSHYHRQVFKRGMQFDISFEAVINDMLDAFGDIPARFADAVTYTRSYNVTDLYASAAGPDVLLYGAPIVDVDGANVTNSGVLPLTIANLEATMQLMAAQADVNGRVLNIRGVHLVVPTSLEFTARAIITSAEKMWVESAGGGPLSYPTTNVISQVGIQLHVDPFLEVIDVSATADTTWYLFADLGQGKAIQMDFLRGYEDPEICMKASDKLSIGGEPLSPFSGDFHSDNIFYRVRDIHGGTRLDPRYTYAQVGP